MFDSAQKHIPVLSKPMLELLEFDPGAVIVDCTVGQAGHSQQLAQKLNADGTLIAIDVDPASLAVAKENLTQVDCRLCFVQDNFGNIAEILANLNINKVDIILADIGISSAQLADADRGISFMLDGPLDMRLAGPTSQSGITAADLLNSWEEKQIADIIYLYGQEKKSRVIAKAIVQTRKTNKFETTGQLVEIINKIFNYKGGYHSQKIHPATRTFQALRIAVNDELAVLEKLLQVAPEIMNENGQIAIISFHSLEDRIVKENFRVNKQLGIYGLVNKKPIVADEQEIKQNRRSRSAKLRIARKLADSQRRSIETTESYRRFA